MQNVPKIVRDRLHAAKPAANHPDADLLTAFAEQALPTAERGSVLDHLARCGECRDIVALALPPSETMEPAVRPARSLWMTWPVLRWGFVAAGVVVVASLGILQYRRLSSPSTMALYKSQSAQVAREEVRPQLSAAPSAVPAAKQDADAAMADRVDEVSKSTGVASEGKTAAPAALPSSTLVRPFRGATNGPFGRAVGGPKPPSQFQFNNQNQQQAVNGAPAPVLTLPADQLSSAKQPAAASETAEVAGAAAPTSDTEGARLEAHLRDQSADSQLFADKNSVSKSKLPVPQPAFGQIAGYVVDASGAVVPNARITVTPATTGKSATAVTDSRGAFLIDGLSTGNYKAQAQAPGFNTTVQDLSYDASRPSTYNFRLNVGSVSETVVVTSAQNGLLQTDASTVGGPINSRGSNYGMVTSNSGGLLPRWTVSAGGALQRSFDQGKSWQTVNVNASPKSSASLEIIARESRAKEVPEEKDADKKVRKQNVAIAVFRAVTATGPDVWAGGSAGALYHFLDAGNHWTHVVPSSAGAVLTGDIVSLEFPDAQNGKVTTSTPEVWTTSDSGQTWQKQ